MLREQPAIPSPLTAADGTELMVALTRDGGYGIVPVTLSPERRQCDSDGRDFPSMAGTGLHAEDELDRTHTITGRPVAQIAALARPGGLSTDRFLGRDEDLLSALRTDNETVRALARIRSGDMEPYYISWYGFYEGRTPWRTDPIALAFVFGLRTIQQVEAALPGRVHRLVMARHVPFEPSDPTLGAPRRWRRR